MKTLFTMSRTGETANILVDVFRVKKEIADHILPCAGPGWN